MRQHLHISLVGLQVIACISLAVKGLAGRHVALTSYLAIAAVFNLAIHRIDPRSVEYLQVWAYFLPINTLGSVWVGWQAYGRSLETSPRAQTLSHRILLLLCVMAALLAQFAQETFTGYGVLSRIDQGVSAALGIFCLLMTPLLNYFYSPRRRPNALTQEWILTVYYAGNALALLATHWRLFPFNAFLSIGTSAICCLGWTLLLTREGEKLPSAHPPHDDDGLEKLAAEAQFAAIARRVKSAARSK